MKKRILILGGYGNTGFLISRMLLQEGYSQLIIAGRNLNQAQQVADQLNREFHTDCVSSIEVDAAKLNSLTAAFEGISIVVVASSTLDYVDNVATAALDANSDYLDVQLSSPAKLTVLKGLQEKIKAKGRCFITDGGFHPGVPAAMVRYAATKFDILEVAVISAAFQLNWKELQFSEATISEFIDELKDFNPMVLKNGEWVKMSMKDMPTFDFGERFSKRSCVLMFLEEFRALPNIIPSLTETGFYIAGFNWMTDNIIMPVAFTAFKVFREKAKRPMGKLFSWGLNNFSKPPFGAVLQLEAKGSKDKIEGKIHMRLSHDDAYVLTAVPVVACLLQCLNGNIRKPGLWLQANLVEPMQFFQDIERLGVEVAVKLKEHR